MTDTVLARVGEREITQSEVDALRKMLGEQSEHFKGEEGDKRLLEEIINQELMYRDALDKNVEAEDDFQKQWEREEASLKKQVLQQYALSHLLGEVKVLPQEVEAYFSANQEHFTEEEKKNPDQLKSQIYMQLMLLRQQATYVNYTKELESKYPVERISKEEHHE